MAVDLEQVLQMSVDARIELVLDASMQMLPFLGGQPAAHDAVEAALNAAARWRDTGAVPAAELYAQLHGLFAHERALAGTAAQSALFCAISGLYYVTWKARARENALGIPFRPLPNDMADVGEATVLECLDFAARAAGGTATP